MFAGCLLPTEPTPRKATIPELETSMRIGSISRLSLAASLVGMLAAPILPAGAQDVQTEPIVMHETNHVTTTIPFREMTPVPWHNLSRVMPEHDRAPFRHVSNLPDPLMQLENLPPVGTIAGLSFDGITDAQGGGFVPPDTNSSV